jgi:putative transposase
MREARLLAPTRVGHAHGPAAHDGTITTDQPDQMWGMDATSCLTRQEGTATVFVVVDHCASECIGLHAAKPSTRFEAVEPLRQGVGALFGSYDGGIAAGLPLRMTKANLPIPAGSSDLEGDCSNLTFVHW